MKKPKFLNLNRYEVTDNKEDADIIIIPIESNGIQPESLFFKRKKSKEFNYLEDTTSAVWERSIRISTEGTQEEYNKRVEWWFSNMSDEYKEELVGSCKKAIENGFDIGMAIGQMKQWLKDCVKSKRKSQLSKYITNNLYPRAYNFLKRKNLI